MRATNSRMAFVMPSQQKINLSHIERIPEFDALGGDGRREIYIREHAGDVTLLFSTAKPFRDFVSTVAGENKHLLAQTFASSSWHLAERTSPFCLLS